MPTQEAKIIIRAIDDASKTFNTIAGSAGGLNKVLGQLSGAGGGGKGAEALARQFTNLNTAFQSGQLSAERTAKGMAGIQSQADRLTISLAKTGKEGWGVFAAEAGKTADSAKAVREQIVNLGKATDTQKMQGLATQMANVTSAFQSGQVTGAQASKAFGDIASQANRMVGDLAKAGQAGGQTAQGLSAVAQAAEQAKRSIDQAGQSIQKTGGHAHAASGSLMELAAKYYLVRNAVMLVGGVFKSAFDFGLLGAQVNQVARSFDTMTRSVGTTPALLGELRAAARGTVSDFLLMKSAQTALIGLSGEFGQEMATSLPHLLEIARAANIANPTLGETSFLFESLTIGLKRLSPRLIDNTGLQLRLGEANRQLADALGKTTEELTSEEQQMALLRATLEAGDRLVEQLGGTTESATDVFYQFKTAAYNAWNELAEGFLPVAQEVIRSLTVLMFHQDLLDQAFVEHRTEVGKTADSYEAYVDEMLRSAVVAGQVFEENKEALIQFALANKSFKDAQGDFGRIGYAGMLQDIGLMDRLAFSVRGLNDAVSNFRGFGKRPQVQQDEYTAALQATLAALDGYSVAMDTARSKSLEVAQTQERLAEAERRLDAALYALQHSSDKTAAEIAQLGRDAIAAGFGLLSARNAASQAAAAFGVLGQKTIMGQIALQAMSRELQEMQDSVISPLGENLDLKITQNLNAMTKAVGGVGAALRGLTDFGDALTVEEAMHRQALATFELADEYGRLNGAQERVAELQTKLNAALAAGADPAWIKTLEGTLFVARGEIARTVVGIDGLKRGMEEANDTIAKSQIFDALNQLVLVGQLSDRSAGQLFEKFTAALDETAVPAQDVLAFLDQFVAAVAEGKDPTVAAKDAVAGLKVAMDQARTTTFIGQVEGAGGVLRRLREQINATIGLLTGPPPSLTGALTDTGLIFDAQAAADGPIARYLNALRTVSDKLGAIPRTVTTRWNFAFQGVPRVTVEDTNQVDAARGAQFTVPPGYPGDRFRVGVSSGEEVTVRTREQQRQALPGGGGTVIESLTLNVNGAGDPAAVSQTVMRELERRGILAPTRLR